MINIKPKNKQRKKKMKIKMMTTMQVTSYTRP